MQTVLMPTFIVIKTTIFIPIEGLNGSQFCLQFK